MVVIAVGGGDGGDGCGGGDGGVGGGGSGNNYGDLPHGTVERINE